jgi:hypothetical protein
MGPRKEDLEEAKNNKIEIKGMVYDRSCTDILCCMIFCLFFAAMGCISIYAIGTGDPWKFLTPFDSDGNQCGMKDQQNSTGFGIRDFTEYKYKFYTDLDVALNQGQTVIGGNNMYTAVCVKECPSYNPDSMPTKLTVQYMPTTTNEAKTDDVLFNSIGSNAVKQQTKIALSNTKGWFGQCFLKAASD